MERRKEGKNAERRGSVSHKLRAVSILSQKQLAILFFLLYSSCGSRAEQFQMESAVAA